MKTWSTGLKSVTWARCQTRLARESNGPDIATIASTRQCSSINRSGHSDGHGYSYRPSKARSLTPTSTLAQARPGIPSVKSHTPSQPTLRTHATAAIATQTETLSAGTGAETPQVLINDLRSQEIVVDFNNGVATRYPSFWLRDHCPCAQCTHPQTRQRQIDTFELDLQEIKAKDAQATPSGLVVRWTDESRHTSVFPWGWLMQHTPFTPTPRPVNPRGEWQHVAPSSSSPSPGTASWLYPTVDYENAMNTDTGLAELLSNIRRYGFTFVASTPASDPSHTEGLAERIAFIRQTHYGGFWEVVSRADPIDTAYTNLFLPNHTDNTYFTDPCGLQMFHCLSHISSPESSVNDGKGGESTLVDGFAAARRLYKLNRDYYKVLSNVRIVSHASGDPVVGSIMNTAVHAAGFPVLTHLNPSAPPHPQNLSVVRWNNSDRHSSTQFPSHQSMTTWYAAARLWNSLLHSPEFEIVVKLQPGTVVVFDNWRVLHGRKAFEGIRRLCGAYIGMDDFLAKGRAVDARLDGVEK